MCNEQKFKWKKGAEEVKPNRTQIEIVSANLKNLQIEFVIVLFILLVVTAVPHTLVLIL